MCKFEQTWMNLEECPFEAIEDLTRIEERLREKGYQDAADEIFEFQAWLKIMRRRVHAYQKIMQPLVRAVEKNISGDWGKDRIERSWQEILDGKGKDENPD